MTQVLYADSIEEFVDMMIDQKILGEYPNAKIKLSKEWRKGKK